MKIKVFLVDDHDMVRQGVRSLLESNPNTEVVGEAANGKQALLAFRTVKPDIVLMDIRMPVMDGIECTRLIKQKFPEIKVLILSMHDSENYLPDILDAAADGYILKATKHEELLFAIQKIANGGMYMGPEFTLSMLAKNKTTGAYTTGYIPLNIKLTERELDVLHLVAKGLTNDEMAQKLSTSVGTIETRRKKLLDKTGTNNTATLIRYAVLNGLIR
jgi:DNA-binding NarL/FixJ family response regulator